MKQFFSVLFLLVTSYSQGQTDLELTYATFLGGSLEDSGSGIVFANDEKDRYVVFGNSASNDLPVTTNAYQSELFGFSAGYFGLFSIEGDLEYASYLGANGQDIISSAAIGIQNRLILVGTTTSTDFPNVNPPAGSTGEGTSFITCFDGSFNLLWSTNFGGDDTDGIVDVQTDSEGNIFIVGLTTSPDLGSDGVHTQNPNPGSDSDGFVAKLNSDGELLWYTYISGTGTSIAEQVVLSPDESTVYVSGSVEGGSDHGFLNSHQSIVGGSRDCVLLAYDASNGTMNWGTYYGGEGFESSTSIAVLENGQIVFSGTTDSDNSISSIGSFQEDRAGGSDNFLALFSPFGVRAWSTYFGGDGTEFDPNLNVAGDQIYLNSSTSSSTGMTIGEPIIDELSGSFVIAAFLCRFDDNGTPVWSTYVNENYQCAGATSFEISGNASIYATGTFNSNSTDPFCLDFVSPNAFQPSYAGGISDFGIFHFEENYLSTSFQNAEPLTIYPNPTRDFITIEAPNLLWAGMELTVTDFSGRQVDRVAQFQSGNSYSTSHLSEGVYVLVGRYGERVFRDKLVVQR
ncbi:MAG: T9SS type A sorting domain-containing protein [Bacteroidota bacterium]